MQTLPADRATLEKQMIERARARAAQISRVPDRNAPLPLSFAQERLWLIEKIEPEEQYYFIPSALRIQGMLRRDLVQQSVDALVARHEALRTNIDTLESGEPVQRIQPPSQVPIAWHDWRGMARESRDVQLRPFLEEQTRMPFDLAHGLMLRVTLVQLGDEDHALLFVAHHIAADGWSLTVMLNEWTQIYDAFSRGASPQLRELPVQYVDYACWQRDRLRGAVSDGLVHYWKEKLAGLSPLELPLDHARPLSRKFRALRSVRNISKDLREKVRALAHQEDATLFMTLLTGVNVLFSRYTRQEDITLGTVVANRERAEVEGVVGFFPNTLVLRSDLSGNPTFRHILRRTRQVTLEAYDHQELPFERVVEELHPERKLGQTPLFQVLVTQQIAPKVSRPTSGIRIERIEFDPVSAKFDLMVTFTESADGLRIAFIYNSALFEASTVDRMLMHLERLLEDAASDPEKSIASLEMLSAEERQKLLEGFAGDRGRYYPEMPLHRVFEERAAATPDAVALVCNDERITYLDLNRRSNALAAHLQKRGIAAGDKVAFCLERSVESVVSMLAVLKAGAAYVPLDPAYPKHRLEFMIRDASAKLVITRKLYLGLLAGSDIPSLCIDAWQPGPASEENPASDSSLDDLAYVMYTSGSTGTPKGVEILQRGIARLVAGQNYIDVQPSDVFLHLAPLTFDASTLEIWAPLLNGACCVIYPDNSIDLAQIGETLQRCHVTHLWLTTALFNRFIDDAPEALGTLRYLATGGEVMSVAHARRALALLPNTTLVNGYGPTESTTFAACYRLPKCLGPDIASIPIGSPIHGTQLYVVGPWQELMPVGIPGELLISGDGVGKGYVGRPELTAEKFMRDPFNPGDRIYRTGDLVRWLPDGSLEFMRRLDNQVKVRGIRIEPEEIEAALHSHSGVKTAAVAVQPNASGDACLVAYLVSKRGTNITPREIREFLMHKLPASMVPSIVVAMDDLPLTPAGKVDRARLPKPQVVEGSPQVEQFDPRNETVIRLLIIWEHVLHRKSIGLHDDFFQMGGHSLLAAKLVARVGEVFGLSLPVSVVFEAPTVARLAEVIEKGGWEKPTDQVVRIQTAGTRPPLILVGWRLLARQMLSHLGEDQPCYGVSIHNCDTSQITAPYRIEDVASGMVKAVEALNIKGPMYVAGFCLDALYAYEVARQLRDRGSDVPAVILLDPPNPTGTRNKKPIRIRLSMFRNAARRFALRVTNIVRFGYGPEAMAYVQRRATVFFWHWWRLSYRFERYFGVQIPRSSEAIYFLAGETALLQTFAGEAIVFRSIAPNRLERNAAVLDKTRKVWGTLAARGLKLHAVETEHMSILREPSILQVAAELDADLAPRKQKAASS